MSNEILNGSNFNVEEITYAPMRVSPQGGKNIKLVSSKLTEKILPHLCNLEKKIGFMA